MIKEDLPQNSFVIEIYAYNSKMKRAQFIFGQVTSIIVIFFCCLATASCITLISKYRRRQRMQEEMAAREQALAMRQGIRIEQARQILAMA